MDAMRKTVFRQHVPFKRSQSTCVKTRCAEGSRCILHVTNIWVTFYKSPPMSQVSLSTLIIDKVYAQLFTISVV